MKKEVIVGGVLLAIVLVAMEINAGECEYGTAYAWVKTEGNDWRNATVHETLKVHEPFEVKVKVTTKVDCVGISVQIYGYGKAYEVISGPSEIEEWLHDNNLSAGTKKTYQWTVRPTGKFTDGKAPLNARAEFIVKKYGKLDYKFVDFTIIAAYISSEEWEGNGSNGGGNGGGGGIPGFEGALMVTAILAVGAMNFLRKNARNKNG